MTPVDLSVPSAVTPCRGTLVIQSFSQVTLPLMGQVFPRLVSGCPSGPATALHRMTTHTGRSRGQVTGQSSSVTGATETSVRG